jgi:hypothetical protein
MLPNAGAAVYGTITVGAILAAESAGSETYGDTVGAVSVAILLVWLAGAYAEFTEDRLELRKGFTLGGFGRALAHEVGIIAAAAIPLVEVVIFWVTGGTLTSAVTAAVWTTAAMVVTIEVVVGLRAELRGRKLAAHTALGALFGVLIIALKFVLHG